MYAKQAVICVFYKLFYILSVKMNREREREKERERPDRVCVRG